MNGIVIALGMYAGVLNQITSEQQARMDARAPWVYGITAALLLIAWIMTLVLGGDSGTSRQDSSESRPSRDDSYYESDTPAGDRPGAGRGGPGKL